MKIAVIVLSVFCLSFLISYISVNRKLKNLTYSFSQVLIAYESLTDALGNKNFFETKTDEDTHKENFIKFLSDSRDWAFEYIEEVQEGLNNFINSVDGEIKYFDEYGIIDPVHPTYFSMKKISEEYKKLKTLLPEESDDRR